MRKKMEMIQEEDCNADMTPSKSIISEVRSREELESIQSEDNFSQYYSAKSELNDIEDVEIRLKNDKRPQIQEIARRKDSLGDEIWSDYELQSDYLQMKVFLENQDWAAVRELDKKILVKERAKRKQEINLRLENLKRFEDNLACEMRRPTQEEKFEKKELYLANMNKGEGYSILTEDEVEEKLIRHTFCGSVFYIKK